MNAAAIATRFPPEPNGYASATRNRLPQLRIAAEFGGTCNLRFDDTNPTKRRRVRSVDREDVRWLDSHGTGAAYASDYFERFTSTRSTYRRGRLRGQPTAGTCVGCAAADRAGTDSPYRNRRSARPRICSHACARGFETGPRAPRPHRMASPTSTCAIRCCTAPPGASLSPRGRLVLYPMYYFAHPPSDASSGSPSLCTLEFEITGRSTLAHRHLPVPAQPRQIDSPA